MERGPLWNIRGSDAFGGGWRRKHYTALSAWAPRGSRKSPRGAVCLGAPGLVALPRGDSSRGTLLPHDNELLLI
jgi:hypothetical protein